MADHLSIGEVLSLLQAEFPDVTISKIRFLEAQGLLVPERTPSGYRKFYEPDIERLRWILVQQREKFLPLKVIKDRLQADGGSGAPGASGSPAGERSAGGPESVGVGLNGATGHDIDDLQSSLDFEGPPSTEPASTPATVPVWMADLARQAKAEPDRAPAAVDVVERADEADEESGEGPGEVVEVIGMSPDEARRPTRRPSPLDGGPTTVSLTSTELADAAGIPSAMVRELEQYGLLVSRPAGDGRYYDGDALVVARKAAVFARHGIEARHLRTFKLAADREASLLEQVTTPLRLQRHPHAGNEARELLDELATVGESFRAALLRTALRQHLQRD